MYPDSVWNKVLVISNESKFKSEEIVEMIEKFNKNKLTLDDLYYSLSKVYDKANIEQ